MNDPRRRGRVRMPYHLLSHARSGSAVKRVVTGFMDVGYTEELLGRLIVLWWGTSDLFDVAPDGTPTPEYTPTLCEATIDDRTVFWGEVTHV